MTTIKDISEAIANAPSDKKVETARRMLEQYEGRDKELIEPDILSAAILEQRYDSSSFKTDRS